MLQQKVEGEARLRILTKSDVYLRIVWYPPSPQIYKIFNEIVWACGFPSHGRITIIEEK
jgi:hypothetical protein